MRDPPTLELRGCPRIRIVGVVADDSGFPVEFDSVPGIGQVRVGLFLRTILGDGEAGQLLTIGAELCHPAEHRHGQHRQCAAGLAVSDKRVGFSSCCSVFITDALKEIVCGTVGSI